MELCVWIDQGVYFSYEGISLIEWLIYTLLIIYHLSIVLFFCYFILLAILIVVWIVVVVVTMGSCLQSLYEYTVIYHLLRSYLVTYYEGNHFAFNLFSLFQIVKSWVKQLTRLRGYTGQMVEDANAIILTFGSYRLGVSILPPCFAFAHSHLGLLLLNQTTQ